MEYINISTDDVAEKTESKRIRRIHERVRSIKHSEKIGVKLMQAWEERYYDRLEAREAGFAEGRAEGVFEVIGNMLKNNLPLKTIIECSGVSEKEIIQLAKELNIVIQENT